MYKRFFRAIYESYLFDEMRLLISLRNPQNKNTETNLKPFFAAYFKSTTPGWLITVLYTNY